MALSHLKYNEARTGDIILFKSWSLLGLGTRIATRSEYNHAAIALWLDTKEGRRLHLLESSLQGEHDVLRQGEPRQGVSVVDIDQVMHKYDAMIVRKVKILNRDNEFKQKLLDFIEKYRNYKFRKGIVRISLMNAGWVKPAVEEGEGGDQEAYCSEFCALWLKHLGLVSDKEWEDFPTYRVCPGNFDDPNHFDGALLGDPICVYDSGIDGTIKAAIFTIEMCSLFLYILLTVADEKRYQDGHRRKKKSTSAIIITIIIVAIILVCIGLFLFWIMKPKINQKANNLATKYHVQITDTCPLVTADHNTLV